MGVGRTIGSCSVSGAPNSFVSSASSGHSWGRGCRPPSVAACGERERGRGGESKRHLRIARGYAARRKFLSVKRPHCSGRGCGAGSSETRRVRAGAAPCKAPFSIPPHSIPGGVPSLVGKALQGVKHRVSQGAPSSAVHSLTAEEASFSLP